MYMQDACILSGSRVVVPEPGPKLVIEKLHAEHQGMSRMKSLGGSFVWWPNMDADVGKCQVHQKVSSSSSLTSLGSGLKYHGADYMPIMQVHSWEKCFS